MDPAAGEEVTQEAFRRLPGADLAVEIGATHRMGTKYTGMVAAVPLEAKVSPYLGNHSDFRTRHRGRQDLFTGTSSYCLCLGVPEEEGLTQPEEESEAELF